jgi:hypothetical protein
MDRMSDAPMVLDSETEEWDVDEPVFVNRLTLKQQILIAFGAVTSVALSLVLGIGLDESRPPTSGNSPPPVAISLPLAEGAHAARADGADASAGTEAAAVLHPKAQ